MVGDGIDQFAIKYSILGLVDVAHITSFHSRCIFSHCSSVASDVITDADIGVSTRTDPPSSG